VGRNALAVKYIEDGVILARPVPRDNRGPKRLASGEASTVMEGRSGIIVVGLCHMGPFVNIGAIFRCIQEQSIRRTMDRNVPMNSLPVAVVQDMTTSLY